MKYWAYINNEILGPYEKEEIKALPAYSPSLLICPQTPVGEKTEEWREVSVCPEFSESSIEDSHIVSEQIPDQIEMGTLQIDHNFNMSNSGRLNSSRMGQLKPLENAGMSFGAGADIPSNKLARSGRVKASDINWNLAAAEQEAANAAQNEQQNTAETFPPAQQLSAASDPEPAPSSDPFGDIYKDIAGTGASQDAQQVQGLETMPSMADSAPVSPSIGEMPMQNTQEFSIGEHSSFNSSHNDASNTASSVNDDPFVQETQRGNDFLQPSAGNTTSQTSGVIDNSAKISGIEQKIDRISQNAITREDFTMAVDPIKMKLDQFDDMFSSIRNSQNQQQSEVMSKLTSLEHSLQTLVSNIESHSPQTVQDFATAPLAGSYNSVSLTPSDSMKGYGSTQTASLVPADPADALSKEEKTKKRQKKQEIKDTGKKAAGNNIIVRFFKGIIKLAVFIIILAGLMYGAGAGLKYYGVYDVSPMIIQGLEKVKPDLKENHIIMPFLLEESDWQNAYKDSGIKNTASEEQENKEENSSAKENEIIEAVKAYKKYDSGQTLNEKLTEEFGQSANAKWEAMPDKENPGTYTVNYILPESKTLSFSYNENDGTLDGKDDESKAIIQSISSTEQLISEPAAEPEKPAEKQPAKKQTRNSRRSKRAAATKQAETAPSTQQDGEFTVSLDDEE